MAVLSNLFVANRFLFRQYCGRKLVRFAGHSGFTNNSSTNNNNNNKYSLARAWAAGSGCTGWTVPYNYASAVDAGHQPIVGLLKAMELPVFKVDVFTSIPFGGNPAVVCIIAKDFPKVLDDTTMLHIAREVNLSDTAFLRELETGDLSKGKKFSLRWFTPTTESVLCGHATLASAVVLFNKYNNYNEVLEFDTLSGVLRAERKDTGAVLDLPVPELTDKIPRDSYAVIQTFSEELRRRRDELVILYHAFTRRLLVQLPADWGRTDLETLRLPSTDEMLAAHDGKDIRGVILTCTQPQSSDQPFDFFSRYFGHWNGIPEDPATGSAHAFLGKFWSDKLNKTQLRAHQCSDRGGDFNITVDGTDRVYVGGDACIVMSGQLHL